MLDRDLTILGLVLFAGAFAVASVLHSRRRRETLEDHIVARTSTRRTATVPPLPPTMRPAPCPRWLASVALRLMHQLSH